VLKAINFLMNKFARCRLIFKILSFAKLLCDVLLITVHVVGYCYFSDIKISKGSVATRLRCVGLFLLLHY